MARPGHSIPERRTLATTASCSRHVFLALFIIALLPAYTVAQQLNASITGIVTDENKSFIPNATVTVESTQLSVRRTVTTDSDGYFIVPTLPVGIYRVSVEATGFTTYVQENVKLDVGNTLSLPIVMGVKQITQQVDVVDTVYQKLNKENANVETLISGTQVTELALNGRNWAQLVNLAPGTSAINNDSQQGTNVRIDDTAINGLRRRTSPTLDGISNVDHGSVATQVNNISVDAIQEFKLVSSPYSAEYGAQAGPSINVATKRGTSDFHGSLFEFFRHDALNAFSWESKQVTTGEPEKSHLRFNNFGGFVGGPIYKKKLFFFGGLEYKIPRTGSTISELVPTEAMKNGNFSAFLPSGLPANYTCTTPIPAGNPSDRFILCDKSASTNGTPFPNNIIPDAKKSPNGIALMKLWPRANAGLDRYIASPVVNRTVRQELLRVDYQYNQNVTFFGRWLRDHFDSDNPLGSTFDNQALPIAPDNHVRIGKTLLGGYTHVLSPTLVNEALVSWQRNDQQVNYQDDAQIARSTFGVNFTEIFPENRLNKIPEFSVQGYSTLSGNGLPYTIDARNWEVRDNVTWVKNQHTFKFGMLYHNSNKNENTRVRDGGTITYSTGSTAGNAFRPQDSGNALANLLLGAYTRYTETSNTTSAPAAYNQFELYANDEWHVTKRLNVTLGLRMQYIPWPYTDLGNIVGFDTSRFDPAKAPVAANISGGVINLIADPTGRFTRAQGFFDPYNGLVLPKEANVTDPNLERLKSDRPSGLADSGGPFFAPRVGFAWDPFGTGKTVIRGGAGMYFDRTLLNPVRDAGTNAPFATVATITNGRQFRTPANLSGLSGFNNPLDTVGASGAGRPLVQALTAFDFDMPPGAVYAYSLGVQRELPWGFVVDLSYVGNQGRHLTHRRDINYVLPEVALARNASGAFINTTTDLVRQYLGYGTIRSQENTGSSSYNSMQLSAQRRVSRGLTMSLAYTYSKALNNFDTETSDLRVPFDAALDKGNASFDRRHVFAMSYVYALPYNGTGTAKHFLGGWQVSGIVTLQTGQFVSISGGGRNTQLSPTIGYGTNLDLVGDWRDVPGGQTATPVFNSSGAYVSGGWINRAAFAPRIGLTGNVQRNLIEMPGTQNFNLSLMKRIPLSEKFRLQLRGEVFNLFNHPNFRTVVTNFSAANFGALTQTDDPRVLQFGVKLLF
jgi:Carboxypeptidase regulatory-like domain/TonB-dependent Receptor Plug Domain